MPDAKCMFRNRNATYSQKVVILLTRVPGHKLVDVYMCVCACRICVCKMYCTSSRFAFECFSRHPIFYLHYKKVGMLS